MREDQDDLGLPIILPLLVVFVFLLYLFVGIFGTPMTQLEKEEYLKENWPQKYEELKRMQDTSKSQRDLGNLTGR